MKKLVLLAVSILLASTAMAQPISAEQVPPLAFVALQQHYPQAQNVRWKRAQGWYQASYSQNAAQRLVRFSDSGDVEATGENISLTALPLPVRNTLTKHYPTRKICQAARITNARTKAITYEVATCETFISRTIVLMPNGVKVPRTVRK